jgi:hypothetical protein
MDQILPAMRKLRMEATDRIVHELMRQLNGGRPADPVIIESSLKLIAALDVATCMLLEQLR